MFGYTPIYIKEKYTHKYVSIDWNDGDCDWHNFKVLSIHFGMNFTDTPYPKIYFWLMGVDEDGSKHNGVPFTATDDEILNIEILNIVDVRKLRQ